MNYVSCLVLLTYAPDVSLVPLQDLPLQTILNLKPCPIPLAVSYLRAVSVSENLLVDVQTTEGLFQGPGSRPALRDHNEDDILLPQRVTQSQADLRRAMNQLQLGLGTYLEDAVDTVTEAVSEERSLEMLKHM